MHTVKKSYIYLTVICTTPNTVKEMRTLHIKGHLSLKILENVVHATGFLLVPFIYTSHFNC